MQEEPIPGISNDKKVPVSFKNRFVKDVTTYYFGENKVSINIQSDHEKYVYLGVFSPKGWIPIDIALNNKGNVTFKNLEPNIIYQPLISNGVDYEIAGYPFIFSGDTAHILKPDTTTMKNAVLKRKMSLVKNVAVFLYREIIGAKIEGDTDISFKRPDVLYQFNDTLNTNYYELTPPDTNKKYRYIRYVSPLNEKMELGELSVFKDSLCQEKVPLKRMNDIEPSWVLDHITDGNVLTHFRSMDSTCFVAYDLGEMMNIKKIAFSPRNDDNYVWPGDQYELFYLDGIYGWKSLGGQIATERELNYLVPDNALLWLRDLTKGREEQVFIYKNGKQYFTVDL